MILVGAFPVAPLEARAKIGSRVGGYLAAEKVGADAVPEVDVLLNCRQVNSSQLPGVLIRVLSHQLAGPLGYALQRRFAHKHMMRLLGKHEPGGSRQGIEAAFAQGDQLVLAVPVREHGEHEEIEPVFDRLVERAQNPGLVGVSAAPLEQLLRFFPAVPAEVFVEQVHHGPEMAAFLHVHLEEISQVVQAGRRVAERSLLLHAGGLGVPLGDDDAPQGVAKFARDLIPHRLSFEITEGDLLIRSGGNHENPPAILGHPHIVEMGPPARFHGDCRPQVCRVLLKAFGAHFHPPLLEVGLPRFERALEPPVLAEIYIVRNLLTLIGHKKLSLLPGPGKLPICYFSLVICHLPFDPLRIARLSKNEK